MDYDTSNTGGTGYRIVFPENSNIPDIEEKYSRNKQNIHRLEMIAILEVMEELLKWRKNNKNVSVCCSGIVIHTDRYSLSDEELLSPWKVEDWKRKGWKTHEGKPIKNKDLVSQIQKTRKNSGSHFVQM